MVGGASKTYMRTLGHGFSRMTSDIIWAKHAPCLIRIKLIKPFLCDPRVGNAVGALKCSSSEQPGLRALP